MLCVSKKISVSRILTLLRPTGSLDRNIQQVRGSFLVKRTVEFLLSELSFFRLALRKKILCKIDLSEIYCYSLVNVSLQL